MRRLIEYDRETGIQVWHHYDEQTDTTGIEEVQDITPIVEHNLALQNHIPGGAMGLNDYSRQGIKNSWWHVARIPAGVQLKWLQEHGVNLHLWGKCDWTTKKIKRLLNSREYAYLRTGTGRV